MSTKIERRNIPNTDVKVLHPTSWVKVENENLNRIGSLTQLSRRILGMFGDSTMPLVVEICHPVVYKLPPDGIADYLAGQELAFRIADSLNHSRKVTRI